MPGYYTVDHIYPVGFCSTRLYLSINSTSHTCLYTCKVSDSGTAAKVLLHVFAVLSSYRFDCMYLLFCLHTDLIVQLVPYSMLIKVMVRVITFYTGWRG